LDQAIADFTEAIRVEPKIAIAYHNRAVAYARMGRKLRAGADSAEARRLGYAGKP
jgi:Flp pilus assembly protein TadD